MRIIECILSGILIIITVINVVFPSLLNPNPVEVTISEIKPLTSPISMRLYPPLKPHIDSRGLAHTEPIPVKLSEDTIQKINNTLQINNYSKEK